MEKEGVATCSGDGVRQRWECPLAWPFIDPWCTWWWRGLGRKPKAMRWKHSKEREMAYAV